MCRLEVTSAVDCGDVSDEVVHHTRCAEGRVVNGESDLYSLGSAHSIFDCDVCSIYEVDGASIFVSKKRGFPFSVQAVVPFYFNFQYAPPPFAAAPSV